MYNANAHLSTKTNENENRVNGEVIFFEKRSENGENQKDY